MAVAPAILAVLVSTTLLCGCVAQVNTAFVGDALDEHGFCAAHASKALPVYRWPQLQGKDMRVLRRWHQYMRNFDKIESLSVSAYVGAILRHSNASHVGAGAAATRAFVLDIGANMGYYSLVGATLGAHVIAVEMQPKCWQLTRCHLRLNGLLGKATVLNRYVARPNSKAAAIKVPRTRCDTMASPTAVRGRWPSGKLRHGDERINASEFVPIEPLEVGSLLAATLPRGVGLAATKIDTEGFEPHVLEALRPVWPLLNEIILEVQPGAWAHHNLTIVAAMATFRELILTNKYRTVTLPHRNVKRDGFKPVEIDVCRLPVVDDSQPASAFVPTNGGYGSAFVMATYKGFEHFVHNVLSNPGRHGHFHEFLFSNRACRA